MKTVMNTTGGLTGAFDRPENNTVGQPSIAGARVSDAIAYPDASNDTMSLNKNQREINQAAGTPIPDAHMPTEGH